ncbi:MAG: DsbC family protein [Azovibrio sp.]|uniref:DsbC family protein n=1 Tax=Azovibrio sp. TaxID=1872673 RepID=UPI003C72E3E3
MFKPLLPLVLAAGLALPALAQEANVKKAIEAKLGAPVTSITKAGYLGLYEVYFDGQILYTDEKVSAILAGNLIDAKTMTSVTEERMKKLNAIKFSDLPLNQAIKQVKGNGKRVLVTFEDPNCGYCKRLAKDLAKLDNITLYTFLYPILSEDSIKKSRQIWCAADQAKAWNDWMLKGKVPAGKEDCDTTAIINNQEFGQKLRITGTPTLFFADGERVGGAIPMARIEQKLNSIK